MPTEEDVVDNDTSTTNHAAATTTRINFHNNSDNINFSQGQDKLEVPDANTMRILLSTDNHLGYEENDAVRGMDSFAAFEEVLYLAKRFHCDMVLIAGDLFHENRPSRRTLYKTMEIIRRYAMGHNPVKIQMLSENSSGSSGGNGSNNNLLFRNLNGTVNYEDECYSVDMPIFCIHGNHDDPTRDGGELLAALDLLAISNLVNYFGCQEEVSRVKISPVLLAKGTTNVALYGLGSMRDERLNRMWREGKVGFLRPQEDKKKTGRGDRGRKSRSRKSNASGGNDDDDDDDDNDSDHNDNNSSDIGDNEDDDDSLNNGDDGDNDDGFFNLFTLHQNRDLGRGTKNCVQEAMIPDWMDLCVWGHEHECQIDFIESVVGTFRITQPGSSVATSLVQGEAVRKKVGMLDISGKNFRLHPVPLTQVRSFITTELSLREHRSNLDPEDYHIHDKVTKILDEEVNIMILNAREKIDEVLQEAQAAGSNAGDETVSPLKYKLLNPDRVLVRLRVEHSGFSSMNNQRFGAKFVSEVANSDNILLFHRKKVVREAAETKATKKARAAMSKPIEPEELEQTNVEDLVSNLLELPNQKLKFLTEASMSAAMEEFVDKNSTAAIATTTAAELKSKQKELLKNKDIDGTGGKESFLEAIGGNAESQDNLDETQASQKATKKKAPPKKRATAKSKKQGDDDDDDDDSVAENVKTGNSVLDDDDDDNDFEQPKAKAKAKAKPRARAAKTTAGRRRKKDDEEDDDDDEVEVVEPPPTKGRSRRAATKKVNYSLDSGDDDDDGSDAAMDLDGDDDDDDEALDNDDDDDDDPPPKKSKSRAASTASAKKSKATAASRKRAPASRTLSGTAKSRTKSKTASRSGSSNNNKSAFDSDSNDEAAGGGDMMEENWGSAITSSQL